MATKKFKLGLGNRIKGGLNNTRTILTSAGVVTLGAAGAAYTVGYKKGKSDSADEINAETDDRVNVNTEEAGKEQDLQEDVQTTESNEESSDATETISQDKTSSQDQPETGTTTVDPDEVAGNIIEENLTDMEDLDYPTIISVDSLQVRYLADGKEIMVAVFHTPDGEEYQLADIDEDGLYTDVFDMMGNYVGEAEGNLCYSDLEILVEDSNGYLAFNPDEHVPIGDDPTNDIIDTENYHNQHGTEGNTMAEETHTGQTDSSEYDQLSAAELLALLLDDDEENDDSDDLALVDVSDDYPEDEGYPEELIPSESSSDEENRDNSSDEENNESSIDEEDDDGESDYDYENDNEE